MYVYIYIYVCVCMYNPHLLLLEVPQILKTRARVKFWGISDCPSENKLKIKVP